MAASGEYRSGITDPLESDGKAGGNPSIGCLLFYRPTADQPIISAETDRPPTGYPPGRIQLQRHRVLHPSGGCRRDTGWSSRPLFGKGLERIRHTANGRSGAAALDQELGLQVAGRLPICQSCLDFTYDNSTNNIRNPHQPPERIRFGLESRDEMGELYFQMLPRNQQDYRVLAIDFARYFVKTSREFFTFRVTVNPADAEAHKRLGRILLSEGAVAEAMSHIREAIRLDPLADEPHYDLGRFYLQAGKLAEAQREFGEVVRLNPNDFEAFGSLGIISLQIGRNSDAKLYFERALQINPDDQLARGYLNGLKSGPVKRRGVF